MYFQKSILSRYHFLGSPFICALFLFFLVNNTIPMANNLKSKWVSIPIRGLVHRSCPSRNHKRLNVTLILSSKNFE